MTIMKSARPSTIDDLLDMPEDGQKYELVDGKILVSPAGMRHSEIAVQIAYLLKRHLEDAHAGRIYAADVGLILPNGNIRSPDVCYVTKEKLPGGCSPKTFGEVVPDLVVEILSPNDRMRQVADKIGEFLDCGVPLVWLVDPKAETVTIYRSLSNTERLTATDTIIADPVLPGFSAKVSDFF